MDICTMSWSAVTEVMGPYHAFEDVELPSSSAFLTYNPVQHTCPVSKEEAESSDVSATQLIRQPMMGINRQLPCAPRWRTASLGSLVGHVQQDDVLHASPHGGSAIGRRPRASISDWGGSNLGEILGRGRTRVRQASVPCATSDQRATVASRTRMPVEADAVAWGGSLSEVLARQPTGGMRRRPQALPVMPSPATFHREDSSAGTGSSGSGQRQRATIEDFGGGLADVLRAAAPLPRRREVIGAGQEVAFRPVARARAQESGEGVWNGSLSAVLPPRSASTAGLAASEGATAAAAHDAHHPQVQGMTRSEGATMTAAPRPQVQGPGEDVWNGSLSTVLPPRSASEAAVAAMPRFQAQEHSEGVTQNAAFFVGWDGSLSSVLLNEGPTPTGWVATAAAQRATSAVMIGTRGHTAQPQCCSRRARSVVVRKEDAHSDCCAICLDAFEPRQRLTELPCKHRYHTACLRSYFAVAEVPRCPYCRADCSNVII